MGAIRGVGDDFKAGGVALALAPGATTEIFRRRLRRPGWDLYLTTFSLRSSNRPDFAHPFRLDHNGRDLVSFLIEITEWNGEIPLPFLRLEAVGDLVLTITNAAALAGDFSAALRGRYATGRGVR